MAKVSESVSSREAEVERYALTAFILLDSCNGEWGGDVFTVFVIGTGEVVAQESRIPWTDVASLEYLGLNLLAVAWNILCTGYKGQPWKTVGLLRTLRQAIREHFAQGMPIERPDPGCSRNRVQRFLSEARAFDRVHHGAKTF